MGIRTTLNPTCAELAERLARGEYDGAFPWVRLGVWAHFLHCRLCEKYARQLDLLADAFRARGADASELGGLRRRLRERFPGS